VEKLIDLTTKDTKNHEKNKFTAKAQRAQRRTVAKGERKEERGKR
jgi:hypothetical protein